MKHFGRRTAVIHDSAAPVGIRQGKKELDDFQDFCSAIMLSGQVFMTGGEVVRQTRRGWQRPEEVLSWCLSCSVENRHRMGFFVFVVSQCALVTFALLNYTLHAIALLRTIATDSACRTARWNVNVDPNRSRVDRGWMDKAQARFET